MFMRRFDVLLLMVLVTARVRIDTLAEFVIAPPRIETIQKIAWLKGMLPEASWKLLDDAFTDPLTLLLISLTFALVLIYGVIDIASEGQAVGGEALPLAVYRTKLGLIYAIIFVTVIVQSLYLIALRHATAPEAYTHDGGVIQTEETMRFLLQGKNPYTEDYTQTPMAKWGFEYKTALYHYPYLPWTFLASLPFYLVSHAALGWYDQRFVYLLLFAIMLLLAPRLAAGRSESLALVMLLGLNPLMGSDVIFGQNDSFVLFWLVLALALALEAGSWEMKAGGWRLEGQQIALVALAMACASKPTAWFLTPFFFLYVLSSSHKTQLPITHYRFWLQLLPFALTFLLIVLPFALWDPYNFYDDVWAWSAGTSPTAYQIRGWGLANFVLALNWVPTRLAYFPFWIPELLVCLPLFALLLRRQWRANTLPNIAWHGALLLFAFAYLSRFLNENYLGFIVALLALGVLAKDRHLKSDIKSEIRNPKSEITH